MSSKTMLLYRFECPQPGAVGGQWNSSLDVPALLGMLSCNSVMVSDAGVVCTALEVTSWSQADQGRMAVDRDNQV